MDEIDKELLEMYMCGFNDELDGKLKTLNNHLFLKAYNLGRMDAIIGDDVSLSDFQSNEEILKKIKNPDAL